MLYRRLLSWGERRSKSQSCSSHVGLHPGALFASLHPLGHPSGSPVAHPLLPFPPREPRAVTTTGLQEEKKKEGKKKPLGWGRTHGSGVGEVQRGVADDAVANQAVTGEEAAGAERGHQDLSAFGKDPLHRHVAQDRCHRLLQRPDHLGKERGALRQKADPPLLLQSTPKGAGVSGSPMP